MGWIAAIVACLWFCLLTGWTAGYHSARAYLAFCTTASLALGAAWLASRLMATGKETAADNGVRVPMLAFAVILACMLPLGALGRLTLVNLLIAHVIVLGALWLVGRGVRRQPPLPGRAWASWPAPLVAIIAATLAFALAFAAGHSPLTLYDSLSYHLFFAARWVQDHAVTILPTPFSDEAQAYAPGNGELFFAWLMLPFHGDLLARMGQFPFGLLAASTLYALGRRLGASPAHAAYPAAFLLLSRPIAEHLVGANVDLICAALFLTSLYLGSVAVDRDDPRDWVVFGISLGMYLGTKYLALVYAPVFLLLVVARGRRRRALWALPGVVAFGAPWYARNWVVAGSPIYPATLSVAGITLAPGAFSRTAMLNSVFHTSDLRLFPAIAAHALGPGLFVFWLPFAVTGWIAMGRRGWWPHGFLAVVPFVMIPLYWYGLPVNVDSRFLMPAIGPALLPLAFVFTRRRAWNACIQTLFTAGMIWLVVGVHRDLPATLPWFMGGWLALDGLIEAPFLSWFVAGAATIGMTWVFLCRTGRSALPLVATVVVVISSTLAFGAERWCPPSRCDYLVTTPTYVRAGYLDAWRWVTANVSASTIAYTGINLPYPLTGAQLTNRVVYVNIDGRPRWRFHDYDRAYRAGRFAPDPPLLAESSGELKPVVQHPGERLDAVRPRYERMQGIREAWVSNLDSFGVRYLFVAALSAYEVDYVWHNDGRYPVEDDWARSDPARFHLVYENPQVRIYAVDRAARARV